MKQEANTAKREKKNVRTQSQLLEMKNIIVE